ncbi:MAG: hypothetical protein IJV27_07825 [Prevotella sp.]|nr:hypothetical protein [Prevotella sp.]
MDKIIERTHPDGTITYHYIDNGTKHPLTDLGNGRYSIDKGNGLTSFFDANKAKQYREWQRRGGPAADIDKVMLGTLALVQHQ